MSALQRCWRVPAPASRGGRRAAGHLLARVFPPGGPGGPGRTRSRGPAGRAAVALAARRAAPGRRAQGARVQPDARRGWPARATPSCRWSTTTCPSWSTRSRWRSRARAGHPPDRASDLRGAARCARRAAVGRAAATMRNCRADRGCTSRSIAWSMRSSVPRWPAASSACWRTCAPRSATGSHGRAPARGARGAADRPGVVGAGGAGKRASSTGWPATTSRCWDTSSTTWWSRTAASP